MNSGILHLICASLALLIGIGIYNAYRQGGSANKRLRDFSVFFLLFGVYRFLLSSLFFSDSLVVAQWLYNVAIAVFFVMISITWKISLSILGLKIKRIWTLLGVLMTIGLIVILIQVFYDPRLPIIDSSGFVFWNANPFAAWTTSLTGFLVAITWMYTFSKNFLSNISSAEKLKTILMIVATFMIGVSSLTYFCSHHFLVTLASFATAFAGSVCFLLIILISLLKRKMTSWH